MNYNRLSRWYDLLSESSEGKFRNLGLQQLNLQPIEIVLEIGPGTGHALMKMAESIGEAGRIYGTDISEGMLQITQTRIQEAGSSKQINLSQGDATNLSFPDNSFTAVFMSFTLELFENNEIPIVLAECQRVLRQNGRICVVALSKPNKTNPITLFYEWMHRILPSVIDCHPIPVQSLLVSSGFRIINLSQRSMWGLPVAILTAQKSISPS